MYKGLFKFGVFNAVQSTCFDAAGPFNAYMQYSSLTTIRKDHQWKQESGTFFHNNLSTLSEHVLHRLPVVYCFEIWLLH